MVTLTGQNGGHQRAEQDEHEGEEELGGVVVHVFGLVADVEVEGADQDAEQDVRHQAGHSQHLRHVGQRRSAFIQRSKGTPRIFSRGVRTIFFHVQ